MRHRAPALLVVFVGALSAGASACEVPAVSFHPDDGGADAAETGAGADAGYDADGVDGAEGGDATPDALDDGPLDGAGCSAELLGEASACCGSIVCQGDCTGQCPTCEQKCSSPQVCCVHNQSVTCHGPGPCP